MGRGKRPPSSFFELRSGLHHCTSLVSGRTPVLGPKGHHLAEPAECRPHLFLSLNDLGHLSWFYLLIVKQACFVPRRSDSFLERSLTHSVLPKFPRFPSLSIIPYGDFYNYLCNYPTLSLSGLVTNFNTKIPKVYPQKKKKL